MKLVEDDELRLAIPRLRSQSFSVVTAVEGHVVEPEAELLGQGRLSRLPWSGEQHDLVAEVVADACFGEAVHLTILKRNSVNEPKGLEPP